MTWLVIAAEQSWTQNQTKEFDSKNGIYQSEILEYILYSCYTFHLRIFLSLDYSYVAFTTPSTELNQYGFLYSKL